MKKELFYSNKHHMYEIILGFTIECLVKLSVGLEVSIFKKFQNAWSDLYTIQYVADSDDKII